MIFGDEVAIRNDVSYDGRQEIAPPAMGSARRTALFLALALLLAGGWFMGGRRLVASIRTRIAIERLTEASPGRLTAARFTALHGNVLQSRATGAMRGREHDSDYKARVAEVIRLASDAPYAEGRSASAVAKVLSGDWGDAVRTLETAVAARPEDAGLWSDLAAARYERAAAATNPAESLLAALVAVDRSRRINPANGNALFNRALILDRLGLRTVAADAWRACLEVSNDPMMSAEAGRRLEATRTENWSTAQPQLERAVAANDTAVIDRVVDRFPQDARGYGEVIYLTGWANAYLNDDPVAAAQNLQIARVLGEALRPRGETLLAEAVSAIDTTDADVVRTLAIAQQTYDRGRDAYAAKHNAEAERLLKDAAHAFEQGRSPMAFVARMFMTFAIFDQHRTQEAHGAWVAMIADARTRPGYRSLLALLLWGEGRCELFRGRWNESIVALREGRAIFAELGETKNVGGMDEILAEDFERVGRLDLAWQHCIASFRGVSDDRKPLRLQVAIAGGVRIAMGTRSWDVAASLLEVELAVASKLRDPLLTADAFRRLYIVENERKQWQSRDTALMRARIAAAHAGDESQRQLAEIDQAEAVATMESDPTRAVELLTHALEFAVATDRRRFVADLLWSRGRAHAAARNPDAARADFTAGIAELEKQREGMETLELRARFFDATEGLFDDAVALLVDRGDAAAAFQVADRARARALLDVGPENGAAAIATSLASLEALRDTALVEFVVFDRSLVVFCLRNGEVTMHRVPIEIEALRARIEELHRIIDREPPQRIRIATAELYDLLLAPLGEPVATAKSLIIVPDDQLQRVPFAALWNRSTQQYLLHTHAISIAPSAAILTRRVAPLRAQRSALLVGNGAGNEEESLQYLANVDDEIADLRRVYRTSRVFVGPEASKSRFMTEAPLHDVIHFAGHGLADEESLTPSLLFARTENDSGRMYMGDIAKLNLSRGPLVVLAACGTLRGRAVGVEGMPTLARSFLAAGASTVVGTLWDVNDARAGRLMTTFHRSTAGGIAPADALRDAQLDAIARGGENANPKNWAQYVIYTAVP